MEDFGFGKRFGLVLGHDLRFPLRECFVTCSYLSLYCPLLVRRCSFTVICLVSYQIVWILA